MVTTKKTPAEKPAKAAAPRAPRAAKAPAKKAVKAAHAETAAAEAKAPAAALSGNFHKALGRRKEATARVRLMPGSGKITVNGRPFENFFTVEWHRQAIMAPLVAVGENGNVDISVKVEGGGVAGQADAVRHGVARALLMVNPDYRKTLRRAGHLTRDPRAKERKKPGLKRARKRPQWAKR